MSFPHPVAAPAAIVELKYCECCGSLWLRSRDCRLPYCPACAGHLRLRPRSDSRVDQQRDLDGACAGRYL